MTEDQNQLQRMEQMLEQTLKNQERLLSRGQDEERPIWMQKTNIKQQEAGEHKQDKASGVKGIGYNLSRTISKKPISKVIALQQRNNREINMGYEVQETQEEQQYKEGTADLNPKQLTNVIKLIAERWERRQQPNSRGATGVSYKRNGG